MYSDIIGAELLHILKEHNNGVPISKIFEFEVQNYKYGKDTYCHMVKRQIKATLKGIEVFVHEHRIDFEHYLYNCGPEGLQTSLTELLELIRIRIETPQPIRKFTALQWSTIFYFVEPDLYGEIPLKEDKLEKFILEFNVSNSKSNLKNKHCEIFRVINGDKKKELSQKHINAIEAILPFLKKNYHEAFKNAKEDLSILKDDLDRKPKE